MTKYTDIFIKNERSNAKASHIFSTKILSYLRYYCLTNNVVSFEQLAGPRSFAVSQAFSIVHILQQPVPVLETGINRSDHAKY